MLLQQATNSKWYSTYVTAAIAMTLSVLEGHSLLQVLSSATFRICGTSRSPSAFAEVLVQIWERLSLVTFSHKAA